MSTDPSGRALVCKCLGSSHSRYTWIRKSRRMKKLCGFNADKFFNVSIGNKYFHLYIFSTTLQLKTIFRWTFQKQLNTLSEGVPEVEAISDLSRKTRFLMTVLSHQFLCINEFEIKYKMLNQF